jgi:hypothetical protein
MNAQLRNALDALLRACRARDTAGVVDEADTEKRYEEALRHAQQVHDATGSVLGGDDDDLVIER